MTDSSDRHRLDALFASGALLHPRGDVPSIVDLARAIGVVNGVQTRSGEQSSALVGLIGQQEHVVLVLVDGLGMHLLERLDTSAFLRRQFARELRTVFPSSTAPALTSLATGEWPSRHAVTGWWTYLPDEGCTATILPFTERFSEKPLRPEVAQTAYPVEGQMARFDADVVAVQPAPIAGSVSSKYLSGQRGQLGYRDLASAVSAIAKRVNDAAASTFTYFYISEIDAEEHLSGPASDKTWAALLRVQSFLELLHRKLRGRARMIVTADHGQVDVETRLILHRDDELMRLLRFPPSGELRVAYFHVKPGATGFEEAFRQRAGADWLLLSANEAFEAGLFGVDAPSDETRRRIGDFVAIAPPGAVLLYEPAPDLVAMRGTHGGMASDEMRIPLILA